MNNEKRLKMQKGQGQVTGVIYLHRGENNPSRFFFVFHCVLIVPFVTIPPSIVIQWTWTKKFIQKSKINFVTRFITAFPFPFYPIVIIIIIIIIIIINYTIEYTYFTRYDMKKLMRILYWYRYIGVAYQVGQSSPTPSALAPFTEESSRSSESSNQREGEGLKETFTSRSIG